MSIYEEESYYIFNNEIYFKFNRKWLYLNSMFKNWKKDTH